MRGTSVERFAAGKQGDRLAVIAALAISLASIVAGSPPAQARTIAPVITGHAAAGWGYNGFGELGDGTTTDRLLFTPVSGLGSGVVQVAAGQTQSLAVTSGGTVWAGAATFTVSSATGRQLTPATSRSR